MAKLAFIGGPVFHAHRHQTQRVVSDLHDRIYARRGPCRHVTGEVGLDERQPRRACRQIMGKKFCLAGQGWGHREAAIANDLCGDTLADFGFGQRIERQGEVGMGMNIDKAGRQDAPARVNFLHRGFGPPRFDG
jgi:hypothetical protein